MGAAACTADEYRLARRVGELIGEGGAVVLCGGGQGVMAAVSEGAKSAGGLVVGIMPGSDISESPPNEWVDIPIYTGMSDGRNSINAKSADVVIAVAGSFGTLSEIGLALKNGKKVIALNSWILSREGCALQRYIQVSSPEEAVRTAFEIINSDNAAH